MAAHKISFGKNKKATLVHLAKISPHANYFHRPTITRRLWIPTTNSPTFDKCKNEWIYFLDNNRILSIGRINLKLASNNLLVITHWSDTQQQFKFTPCIGCSTTSWLSENRLCQIQIPRSRTAVLPNNNFT